MIPSFGLSHVWTQGGAITRLILVALLSMSVMSWGVIVVKAREVWRHKQSAMNSEQFWHATSLAEGLAVLSQRPDNLFHSLAQVGQEATEHHQAAQKQLHDRLDISDWITRSLRNSIDDYTSQLQNGLAILASIGSTAPFVGLLGTVWGIYHALSGIATAGQLTMEHVAGPVGEALIMTAAGLAVALPAVLAFNVMGRVINRLEQELEGFAHDLRAL